MTVKPFLVDHPEHGRLVVLGFTNEPTPRVIVAGTVIGVVKMSELTIVSHGTDWPEPWPEHFRGSKVFGNA